MNEEDFLIILKRIRILLNKNAWFENKEYLQIELDNLEKTQKMNNYDKIRQNFHAKYDKYVYIKE